MGRLVKLELQKLFQQKMVWLVVGLILALNLGIVCYEATRPVIETADFTRRDIADYYAEHKEQTAEEILEDLNQQMETAGSVPEWKGGTEEELDQWMQAWMETNEQEPENLELYEYLRQRVLEILNYKEYLANIQKEKERLTASSLFSDQNSYSARNMEKTAKQYEKLDGTELKVAQSYDVELVTDSQSTTFLLAVFAVFIALSVFLREWENGTMALISPMKCGKILLVCAKSGAAGLALFFFTILIFLENCIVGWVMFGIGDLSRAVQTLDGYIHSPWKLSVGAYMILFVLETYLGILAVAFLTTVIGICVRNSVLTCLITAIILTVEGFLWKRIELQSVFSLLHGVNYMTLLNAASYFRDFQTINLFGYPVYMGTLFLITAGVFCGLCSILCIHFWNRANMEGNSQAFIRYGKLRSKFIDKKKKHVKYNNDKNVFRKNDVSSKAQLFLKIKKCLTDGVFSKFRTNLRTNLFCQEWYKQMIVYKGLVFLICLLIVQGFCYTDVTKTVTEEDYYYDNYAQQLEGEVYWRKRIFLNTEGQYFEKQERNIEKYAKLAQNQIVSYDYVNYLSEKAEKENGRKLGLEMADEQYAFLERQQSEGKDVKFLSYSGYRSLFENEQADVLDAAKMMLVIILGMCSLFSCEKNTNMQTLIDCAPNGKYRVRHCKYLVLLWYVCMAWAVSFLPRLLATGMTYGYAHLFWSSAGLTWFSYMPGVIPSWMAILWMQLLRIGGGLLAAALTGYLSSRISTVPVTIVVAMVILLLPVVTYFTELTGQWGILSLISGHAMLIN